jgi:sugar lactone lactonase YvrE
VAIEEAWLVGGPADGRLMMIEREAGGGLPDGLTLDQAGVFVGSADLPVRRVVHRYARDQSIDGLATCRYVDAARS